MLSFYPTGPGRGSPPRRSGRDGDTHPAAGLTAVALPLAVQVEAADPLAGGQGVVVEPVGRDQPDDLELEPVRVLSVEALGGAVVGAADQGAGGGQSLGGDGELVEGVDLPGQVVEADGGSARGGAAGGPAELEQAEVVVVGGAGGLEEGRALNPSGVIGMTRKPSTSR